MKCQICHREFYYENLNQLLTLQQICNICIDLFIYKQKNVKMSCVKIEIFYLANYDYLMEFVSGEKRQQFNEHLMKKNNLLNAHRPFVHQKRRSFYYYHTALYSSLTAILAQIDTNKSYEISLFELLM